MFNKPFEQLTLNDIELLVNERKERENNHLDYKLNIEFNDRGKKEFVKDVSGFANSEGGYLVIGVSEDNGVPKEIVGLEKKVGNQKIDEWIDNVLLSNIDKRLFYKMKLFPSHDDKLIILIYIPLSSRKPHMVTYQGANKYYKRHNTITLPATHAEVKEMFDASQNIIDNIKQILDDRKLFNLKNEDFGSNDDSLKLRNSLGLLNKWPMVIFSILPSFLDEKINISSEEFLKWCEENKNGYYPKQNTNLLNTHNNYLGLNNIIFFDNWTAEINGVIEYDNYLKIYRNGYIESAISEEIIYPRKNNHDQEIAILNLTSTVGYFWLLINFVINLYRKYEYLDEIIIQISLVNIKDIFLSSFGKKNKKEIWREPFDFMRVSNPPSAKSEKEKIIFSVIITELTEDKIKELSYKFAEKLSNVFGERNVKCFDDEGNFNIDGFSWFRR
jgi:hypothetical protein